MQKVSNEGEFILCFILRAPSPCDGMDSFSEVSESSSSPSPTSGIIPSGRVVEHKLVLVLADIVYSLLEGASYLWEFCLTLDPDAAVLPFFCILEVTCHLILLKNRSSFSMIWDTKGLFVVELLWKLILDLELGSLLFGSVSFDGVLGKLIDTS